MDAGSQPRSDNGNRAVPGASWVAEFLSLDKLTALVAVGCLVAALATIVATPPAAGYEISIYAAYPPYSWVLIILSFALGVFLLVRQAFAEEKSNLWVAGFAVILLTNSILLLLPVFRGYVAVGFQDPLGQLGFMKEILLTGRLGAAPSPTEDVYPAQHILGASLSYLTQWEAESVMKLIPALFFTFYALSVYLLSRELVKERGPCLLITMLASLPLYTSTANESFAYYLPRMETFSLLPFTLYLYFRSRRKPEVACRVALILMLLVMVVSHPADGGMYLMGVLLTLGFAGLLYDRLARGSSEGASSPPRPLSSGVTNPVLIVFVAWFIWFSAFRAFDATVQLLADSFIYGTQEPEVNLYVGWAQHAGMPWLDVVVVALERQGHHLLFFLPALLMSLAVWKRFLSGSRINPNLFAFSSLVLVSATTAVLVSAMSTDMQYSRLLPYIVLSAAFVNGLGFYLLFRGFRSRVARAARVAMIMCYLLIVIGLGTFNVYPSPFTAGANEQVTSADIRGFEWFLAHQNEELVVEEAAFYQTRYSAALLGQTAMPKNLRGPELTPTTLPERFGYLEHSTFAASYDDDRYFLSHTLSHVIYTERIPRYEAAWKWFPEDFARLEKDPTVARLYTNGGFEVSYIRVPRTTLPQAKPPY